MPSSSSSTPDPKSTPQTEGSDNATGLMRADQLLVTQGIIRSRTRAQRLIRKGCVSIKDGKRTSIIKRPSEKLPLSTSFTIADDPEERYVSRAGLKLEGLLKHHKLSLEGMTLLDIGQSTGGFTDCALHYGAQHIVGIEVGHDQLDEQLRNNSRVTCLEGINARALPSALLLQHAPKGFDAAMIDVSFISQTLILPEVSRHLPSGALLFSLVKPQFELTPSEIGTNGVVRNAAQHSRVKEKLLGAAENAGFDVIDWQPSAITGSDGNQEWMMLARKK